MAITKRRVHWRYAPGVYRRHMITHWMHALVLAAPALLAIATLNAAVSLILLLVVELIFIAYAPRLAPVRRVIEARLQTSARIDASVEREALLQRMSEQHRSELFELERVAAAIGRHCGTEGAAIDGLGVERLIELYVRHAIAHHTLVASLEIVGRACPVEALRKLECERAVASGPVRGAIDRRVAILRMRCKEQRAAYEKYEAIGHELATIGDTLRWLHEHCASASNDDLQTELDAVVASREQDAAALREMCALRHGSFDAQVIPLGRGVRVDPVVPCVRVAPGGVAEPEVGRVGAATERAAASRS